ncbi:hypothetical protein IU449_11825 [Nocardia higoensis]|uniref:SCP domain-containing protein n=1 Tax=Nocardia higoensis TaxID=228599 RepID=A0ABS0D9S5_9NOCA|nr:hypothetical protein [Nocardia higoensis]MBF6355221.1 hypothetical protein [Nocardia higoensis]
MNGRTLALSAVAALTLGVGAVATAVPAVAEPSVADSESAPVAGALTELTERAGEDQAARAGVGALRRYTELVDVAQLRDIAGVWAPFAYAAPTFGCGSNGPITTIIAAATTYGRTAENAERPEPGRLRFSATPAHSGMPLNSGLVVAWVNVNNGRSGIDMLDDRTAEGMPTLSRTVESGPGTVIASMWGVIGYPGAHCVMTPTVGTFSVPDAPLPPAPEGEGAPVPNPAIAPVPDPALVPAPEPPPAAAPA